MTVEKLKRRPSSLKVSGLIESGRINPDQLQRSDLGLSMDEALNSHKTNSSQSESVHQEKTDFDQNHILPAPKDSAPSLSSSEHGFNIDIRKLKSHEWNARVHRTQSRIRDLAVLLAANGQKSPIIITEDPKGPGTFYILDGETRYQSALSLNWETLWVLPIEIDPYKPLAFYIRSLQQTNSTEPISAIDQAIRWQKLIDNGIATLEEIAKEVGKNKSTVSKMLVYSRFVPAVREFMSEHLEKFPYTLVHDLSRFIADDKSEEEVLDLCSLIVAENISRRGLEDLVKRLLPKDSGKRSYNKRKQAQIHIPIKYGNTAIGGFRTFDNGGVEFKIQPKVEMDENLRIQLVSCLEMLAEAACKGNPEEMKLSMINKLNEFK